MILKKNIMLLQALCWVAGLAAQDARTELQRLQASMLACTSIRQHLTYTIYKDHSGAEVMENHSGTYARQGGAFRLQIGESVTLQDGRRQLVLDPEAKTMTLLPAQSVQSTGLVGLDQWLKGCTSVQTLPARNGWHGCRLALGPAFGGVVDRVDLWFDPQKWMLTEVTMYYAHEQNIGDQHHPIWIKPRLRIEYSQTEISPQFKQGDFVLAQYVSVDRKKMSPIPAFKSWQLRDLSGPKK
jgi:outer membrane lipoprotein-sorting protein